jgi:hypothetical protein
MFQKTAAIHLISEETVQLYQLVEFKPMQLRCPAARCPAPANSYRRAPPIVLSSVVFNDVGVPAIANRRVAPVSQPLDMDQDRSAAL